MWTLTVCSLLMVGAVVGATVALVAFQSRVTVEATKQIAQVMQQTVEQIIQPVVDPQPIQQIDVPEQTEMLNEPQWANDWNP